MQLLCRKLLVAAAAVGATLTTAQADPTDSYNGIWRVAMVTEKGMCDPSYQYGIAIADGTIRDLASAGGSVSLSGQVDGAGKVQVVVAKGMARAGATGKLRGNRGFGTWRLPTLGCAGRWSAARTAS